jgi:hypothetical protein
MGTQFLDVTVLEDIGTMIPNNYFAERYIQCASPDELTRLDPNTGKPRLELTCDAH